MSTGDELYFGNWYKINLYHWMSACDLLVRVPLKKEEGVWLTKKRYNELINELADARQMINDQYGEIQELKVKLLTTTDGCWSP